jgi:hypothetical protein
MLLVMPRFRIVFSLFDDDAADGLPPLADRLARGAAFLVGAVDRVFKDNVRFAVATNGLL